MAKGSPQPVGGPCHVAHVIGALRTGGAEKQLVNYLLAADRVSFRHTVLCLDARGDFADQVEQAGIPVRVFAVRYRRLPRDLVALARWLRREDVRIVHTHMHGAALWGRLAGLLGRVPVLVTTEHGKENWKGRLRLAADRWLTRHTFRHIAVSQDVMAIRRRRERVAAERIMLVPNGVPIPDPVPAAATRARLRGELGIRADRPVIGSVGRVVDAKAYPDLLEAVAQLQREMPDVCWLQVGDGPLAADLAAAVRARGMESNVVMAGRREDIQDLLAVFDVWVMSSIREGLPVSLLEAMAAARPIVATRVGGIPDAVQDGVSALLVPPGDPTAMAAAIRQVLTDRELASGLAQAARAAAAAEYGIEAVALRIEDVYRQGLAARGIGLS